MHLRTTVEADVPLIKHWMGADPRHSLEVRNSAEWLLTGNGLLSFCVADDKGPLCFVRLDSEDDMTRAAIQFGPESEVSKRRMVVGLMRMGLPAIIRFSKKEGFKGVIFESVSTSLIEFLKKNLGVCKAAGENDYSLTFGEDNDV